jgi:hypothetical protein
MHRRREAQKRKVTSLQKTSKKWSLWDRIMRRPTQFRERKPKLARTREGKETVIIEEKKENLTDVMLGEIRKKNLLQ